MDNEYVTSDVRSVLAEYVERREVSTQRKDSNELSAEGTGRLGAECRVGLTGTVATSMKIYVGHFRSSAHCMFSL
jgi:hypothetical protein